MVIYLLFCKPFFLILFNARLLRVIQFLYRLSFIVNKDFYYNTKKKLSGSYTEVNPRLTCMPQKNLDILITWENLRQMESAGHVLTFVE